MRRKQKNIRLIGKNSFNEKGITLVALVITIVILIILAVVAVNAVFGDSGLLKYAQDAEQYQSNADTADAEILNEATSYIDGVINGGSGTGGDDTNVPTTIIEAKSSGYEFTEKKTLKDEHNNSVTIPAGFKVAETSGNTVQQGVVIEDVSASTDNKVQGSQYVWIPLGIFTKDDGTESVDIPLGRYTFTTGGTPEPWQDEIIDSRYSELTEYREGKIGGQDGLNATAKDLAGFIESANSNGGYYIGRYEASYASGDSVANFKAASKVSGNFSEDDMVYSEGTLWNHITQVEASKVAINTYADSSSVNSDLMNSYAWDTAIVYMQEAGKDNYANEKGPSVNGSLANTGENGDEVCKINDMSSNIAEWTTEYSSGMLSTFTAPCVYRGGNYNNATDTTADRSNMYATYSTSSNGFRVILYI